MRLRAVAIASALAGTSLYAGRAYADCDINVQGNNNVVFAGDCKVTKGDFESLSGRRLVIAKTLEFTAPNNRINLPGWDIVFKPGGKLRVYGGKLEITARSLRTEGGARIDIDATGVDGKPGQPDPRKDGNGGYPGRREVAEKYDPDGRPHWDTANHNDFINANVQCDRLEGGNSWGLKGNSGEQGGAGATVLIHVDREVPASWQWTAPGGAGGPGGPGGKGTRHWHRGSGEHHECPSGGQGDTGPHGEQGSCKLIVGHKAPKDC